VTTGGECFWATVYPLYMQRDITRTDVRDLVRKGLEEARGSYKIVVRLFNMELTDYKKFLNFLRKHECQLPFQAYRQIDRDTLLSNSNRHHLSAAAGAPMGPL
jgi:hypothetical protein